MPNHIVSRVVSSVVCVPDENDPNKSNTYNIFMDQASGCCVLHEGTVVHVDKLQPAKDKAFVEHEILLLTTAIQSLSNNKQ
ncbi:MAG: hypothetical protein C0406_06635 [Sideroxydans sp.]|nr:hypothetical protein [Sideroxydans sp.]